MTDFKEFGDKIWVIEFSKEQNTYHFGTLREVVDSNLNSLVKGLESDWMIVGFSNDLDNLPLLCDKIQEEFKLQKED